MPRLTVEAIRRQKAQTTRLELPDKAARGLYLYVEPSGTKRFVLRYKVDGKTYRHGLGTFGDPPLLSLDTAREQAHGWREKIKRGEYPHEVLARERELHAIERKTRGDAPTLSDLADLFRTKYLERHTRRPDHRLITFNRWIIPEIGAAKLADIRRRHLNAALDKVADAGHGVAAYGLARLLGQMFRFAVDEELIETTPAERLRKGSAHTPGDRVLSDDELREVWKALDHADLSMSDPVRVALKVLLLTGARSGELCAARWADIRLDGDMPTWNIPRTATKTGSAHAVPLTKTAVSLFRKLHEMNSGEFVLPGRKGGTLNSHVIATALRRCFEAEQFSVKEFGAHDLRRTMRTGLVRLGISTELAERIIGHKPRNVLVQTYDLYDRIPERRKALMLWDQEVTRIVSGKPNVASIKRKRA